MTALPIRRPVVISSRFVGHRDWSALMLTNRTACPG
jgi:hypothetical protein